MYVCWLIEGGGVNILVIQLDVEKITKSFQLALRNEWIIQLWQMVTDSSSKNINSSSECVT